MNRSLFHRQYDKLTHIKHHMLKVSVLVKYEYDDFSNFELFDTDHRDMLSKGQASSLTICVYAMGEGEVIQDAVHGCLIRNSHFSEDIDQVVKEYNLIDGSIEDLKHVILDKAKRLQKYNFEVSQ